MNDIEPVRGACVWRGGEMVRSARWRRQLSPAQLAELDTALAAARARGLAWHELYTIKISGVQSERTILSMSTVVGWPKPQARMPVRR